MDKAILGKMGGVYVTYVADVDNGQWHLTLVWSFKASAMDFYTYNTSLQRDNKSFSSTVFPCMHLLILGVTCWLYLSWFFPLACYTKNQRSTSKLQMHQRYDASFNFSVSNSFALGLFKDKMIPNAAPHLIHLITIKHFALLMDSSFLFPTRASMLRDCRRQISQICTQILSELPLIISTASPLILHHISRKKLAETNKSSWKKIQKTRLKNNPKLWKINYYKSGEE